MTAMIETDKKILLTGCRGTLGRQIQRLVKCDGIDRSELDITDEEQVKEYLTSHHYDVLIHCAAFTDVAGSETRKEECYRVNVTGTENLIRHFNGKKFVYLSTEYVFDGQRGNYSEHDTPHPVNYYALTKLLGETAVRQYRNSLIIRTSFKPDGPWPYPNAFSDQWTSADYASQRAPDIIAAALAYDLYGTIHIGGQRKTIYDLARQMSPTIGKMSIKEAPVVLPRDVSLDSGLWINFKKNHDL